jgi:predicted Zn-dependent peptidase
VEREEVEEALATFLEPGPLRRGLAPPPEPAQEPVSTEYDAITAWVSASYHFGPEADVESLRLLAHLAVDAISFGPSRRSVYDSRTEVLRHAGGGGELRIHLVVPPREAELWSGRIRAAVAAYVDAPLPQAVFAERLRRYRGARLLELDSPEARARALARLALVEGSTEWMVDLEGLSPERLHAAARALAAPVLVFLGPFEGEDGV